MIGLSGLITPSLDEMVYTWHKEMEREGIFRCRCSSEVPPPSRAHTAVKIAQHYRGQHRACIRNASRAVGVVSNLLNDELKRLRFPERSRSTRERTTRVCGKNTPRSRARRNWLRWSRRARIGRQSIGRVMHHRSRSF